MKGRAKLLDSRFMEFIEYLQKMGELHNILRMIDSFYGMNGMDCSELDTGHYNVENSEFIMLFSFWRKGWIEIRETERRRKDWHIKEYALLVRLDEIAAYCAQEKHQDQGFSPSDYPMPRQDIEALV
jgi:predicted transcriptional regulator